MQWGPRAAGLEPALNELDALSEVEWAAAADPARFDALWNHLFKLAEAGNVGYDADSA